MTVATTNITSGPYIGNGTGNTFSYDFRIEDESQLSVYETTDIGAQVLLILNTDYTVAGVGVDGGGIITRIDGNLPVDYIWYIRSNYSDTQDTVFASQGGFFPGVHESAFDKLTFLLQQLLDKINRSPRLADFDESAETADLTIPGLATRVSQYLGFDANGDLITIAGVVGDVAVSSFMRTLLDDNDIETAHGTLGLSKGTDVASAGTLNLGTGSYFDITGTTAITFIATKGDNAPVIIQFDGILTFTHDATALILPGGANITTAAGDHAIMKEYDAGKWRCVGYFRASSLPALLTVNNTFSGDNIFNNAVIAPGGVQTDNVIIKTKMLHIGPWNMDTIPAIPVAHGLTLSNIRSVKAMVRKDDGSAFFESIGFSNVEGSPVELYISTIDATNVTVRKRVGGFFDGDVNYNAISNTIDNAAAVDKGDGLVGIPITANTFAAKDVTIISGTTNYDATYKIVSQTVNEIVITATYIAETFAGTELASWSRGWIMVEYEA